MEKKWTIAGLALLITGIILGAFGAHALKDIITDPEKLASFETGVRYQLIHGAALFSLPYISDKFGIRTKAPFYLVLSGVLLFSCSIYLLAMKDVWHADGLRFLGPVTPIGGTLMIAGWCILLLAVARSGRNS
jgi:uncharacterized membrane protein YgdD (TMEM256/DUF423 family)